jgi:multidrug efflux system membrane fusion protein
MRPIPVLTAILVTLFLYYLVIEREALLSFAGVASADAAEPVAETPDISSEGVGVIAMHSTARVIDSAVILRGQTEAARQVNVEAETSGQIVSEPLRKGSHVVAGQVLCQIDPGTRPIRLAEAQARLAEARARIPETEARIPEAEAKLVQAKAQLEEARINDNAARKLSEGGFASETRVASAEAAVRAAEAGVIAAEAAVKSAQSGMAGVEAAIQSAEASVAATELDISKLTVTAPFDGLLETDTAELGSLLQANGPSGAVCATIIQLDPIKLVGFVPETDVARVKLGAPAGARLATGDEITGLVKFLSRSADPATRTFRVEIEVPNPDLAIRDGQTAEILIAADGVKAHLVPQSVLTLNDQGTLGVRLVDSESRAKFAPVHMLRDTADGIWIDGLPDTADIIVIGQEFVTDGVALAPRFQEHFE